jgi:integrase
MTISIKRAIRMGVESSPKTANSYRVIDIIEQLVPYLKEQFEKTGHKNSYLFLTANDTPLFDAKSIRDCDWKTMFKRLKIEYRPLYHMRHSFASLMIANGEDILWVSNMLGHVSSKMTLDRYARYLKRDKKIRAGFLKI